MKLLAIAMIAAVGALVAPAAIATEQTSPGAGPIIVLDTAKGTIEIETYPEEAPKTVAHVLALIKKNFYNGLRFHRAEPGFVIQVGDPQTRDMTKQASWGRGNSGTPIGVAEITKKRRHGPGAVGMAHGGSAKEASSQFYITLRASPTLDGKYVVFGKVIKGLDVAAKIQIGDVLKKASVRE
jgi:peptidyl-prolyl cis-trans isomerase B (cyclophilin B)